MLTSRLSFIPGRKCPGVPPEAIHQKPPRGVATLYVKGHGPLMLCDAHGQRPIQNAHDSWQPSDSGGDALLVLLEALGQQALQHAAGHSLLQRGLQDQRLPQQVLHLAATSTV